VWGNEIAILEHLGECKSTRVKGALGCLAIIRDLKNVVTLAVVPSVGGPAAATPVTAGALVAVADKHVDAVERDGVVHYSKERMLAPGSTGPRIVKLFNECARRLQEPDFLDVTIEAFRPVRGCLFLLT
jgi:hypothetical protein